MPHYGLFPAEHFEVLSGSDESSASPQARWYFRCETIAVPKQGLSGEVSGGRVSIWKSLADWSELVAPGSELNYPPLVWLGAPDCLRHAELADGQTIRFDGNNLALQLVPRHALNRSYYSAASQQFMLGQGLKIRGRRQGQVFVVRTFWPERFSLPENPQSRTLAAEPAVFRDWLRAQPQGGAQSPFAVESIWRRPGGDGTCSGQPVLGVMLNGAQGDDDETHSGHFAMMTGYVGEGGAMDDWLVNNFYTLDSVSEKGIIAAPVPLDNYLADLNSGQAWYRPSYMLVATLRNARTAVHLQAAFGRVYNQFYRHQFAYQHARANCTGLSVTTARLLGWRIPARGAESWLKAIFGLPLLAIRERSLAKGKAMFDYLTEDQTRLYPAAAFEEMGADLLRLASGRAGRQLSEFERLLAEDVEEILLVRVPQFPSSRAWGDFPVETSVEYLARMPRDPAQRQIVPVPPRPFPDELRDPESPAEPPLRSDYAVAGWFLAFLVLIVFILRRLLA